MNMIISKWGNSLGVRIPGAIAKSLGLKEGSEVRIDTDDGRVIIEPAVKDAYDLKTLLAKVTPENCHDSVETGKPVGREAW
ncbi:MAG: AbrB/MazE/SpoVT family DNA-binding domain-containing protein [Alphaproteobacteria bacterium]|nr:AbrB/MazE/SpoVT family DNA-binding domain-containing protein [Alphaproteobacteria bacterium]